MWLWLYEWKLFCNQFQFFFALGVSLKNFERETFTKSHGDCVWGVAVSDRDIATSSQASVRPAHFWVSALEHQGYSLDMLQQHGKQPGYSLESSKGSSTGSRIEPGTVAARRARDPPIFVLQSICGQARKEVGIRWFAVK